jgi:tRNA A37 methylthiotransferase MiaB
VAAKLDAQVPPDAKKARMAALLALGEELSVSFREGQRGSVRPVLWESLHKAVDGRDLSFGHTDNYLAVYADARQLAGRMTPVQLGQVYHDGVWGNDPEEDL